ncbi:MAG: preprotein translocase subunit SecG [Alphaproteobacteria bacterium]|nr:preprotein translocase subunit SecG [Alphaproteobacteria bacterium]USO07753.1 MAG: preprotein translocase subunit SecG [Rhodospirillales bacterium]
MQEVVLVIHLILAVTIIGLVLIQRSSGGGLGIGGGSGGLGDFATARGTANALTKATTIAAFAFFLTSLTLAYMGKGSAGSSLLSGYDTPPAAAAQDAPATTDGAAAPATTEAPAPVTPEPPVPSQ